MASIGRRKNEKQVAIKLQESRGRRCDQAICWRMAVMARMAVGPDGKTARVGK